MLTCLRGGDEGFCGLFQFGSSNFGTQYQHRAEELFDTLARSRPCIGREDLEGGLKMGDAPCPEDRAGEVRGLFKLQLRANAFHTMDRRGFVRWLSMVHSHVLDTDTVFEAWLGRVESDAAAWAQAQHTMQVPGGTTHQA